MPLRQDIHKVMVIGSGPIVIGQAAEFDYAGTQACRALKEDGLEVVLVNSNPATIMTDNAMADEVYIEPLTLGRCKTDHRNRKTPGQPSFDPRRSDGSYPVDGARESGLFRRDGVKLLGANPETIDKAEDRQ